MSVTRDDVQDSTGQRTNIPGRGFTRGFGTGSNYYLGTGGSIGAIPGNPINGEVGWSPGALFVNPITAIPGNFLWENIGTVLSAQWMPLDPTGGNTTITPLLHAGRTMLLSNAGGFTVSLPAATGTGNTYSFFTAITITSNNYLIDAKPGGTSNVMSGIAVMSGSTSLIVATAANTNLITMNGSTTGGVIGDLIKLIDVALNQWSLESTFNSTGTAATPFSHH
jgi:hypothetical protein